MATHRQRAQAELYRDAAVERIGTAHKLYEIGRWVESNYLAGLAVECILRAYRWMIDPEFDSRHNIDRLYKLAKFADVVPNHDAEKIVAALGNVIAMWSNDHRFSTVAAIKNRWLRQQLHKRGKKWIKGDFLKERTRELVNSATEIVNTGVGQWQSSFKN
ncbi:MAG: hypothetical protein ABSH08_01755 [Tepidisphaeraceae bacterium]|jgi:hypothetical protein